MKHIRTELTNFLLNADLSIQQILFILIDEHPAWEDNLEVLQLATKQILQPLGSFPNEQVLAFVGLHAKTGFVGKRNSIGFLITNCRILTQTDFSVIGTTQDARGLQFTAMQNHEQVSATVWNSFITKNSVVTSQEHLSALYCTLKGVVEIVLSRLQGLGCLPIEGEKSTNIEERIKELGLRSVLKSYESDKKILSKFSKKFNVPDIRFGVTDKPFFGAPYGLVITPKGITSRDVMEDSITSSWEEIRKNPAAMGEKKDVIIAGFEQHIIPMFQTEFVPSLITLINELSTGEVRIE